jgi:Protein of unknown function (DUF2510)
MTRLDSPAGETKRAEPGWYPNAYGWKRLQYWDGERWTQSYRSTSGEEQARSGKSPAVQDLPDIEAHALFWQPNRIITVVPKEPVPVNPIGIGLALIGAALMIIGMFLPRVESQQFFSAPRQHPHSVGRRLDIHRASGLYRGCGLCGDSPSKADLRGAHTRCARYRYRNL